jgi:anti-sigma regulatory factor (Ser/Thr protein kinase)
LRARPVLLQRQWTIPLSISALWALIVRLEHLIRPYCPTDRVREDVMLAVIEALSNAFGSSHAAEAGQRITVRLRVSPRQVAIDVKDPGGGFAHHERARQLVDPAREGGRGLYLIEQVMDDVSWSPMGNGIHMVRRWLPQAS